MKKLYLTIAFILCFAGLSNAQWAVDPDSLTAYWDMDSTATPEWHDLSGNGFHLSENNSPEDVAGQVGRAADLESQDTDALYHADNDTLDTGDIDLTYACWIKMEGKAATGVIMQKGLLNNALSSANRYGLLYSSTSDSINFNIREATLAGGESLNLFSPSTGTWYFLCGRHDAVNDSMFLTYNDVDSGRATTITPNITGTTSTFSIGAESDNTNMYDGIIDEVMYWKRKLSETEVDALYENGLAGKPLYLDTLFVDGTNGSDADNDTVATVSEALETRGGHSGGIFSIEKGTYSESVTNSESFSKMIISTADSLVFIDNINFNSKTLSVDGYFVVDTVSNFTNVSFDYGIDTLYLDGTSGSDTDNDTVATLASALDRRGVNNITVVGGTYNEAVTLDCDSLTKIEAVDTVRIDNVDFNNKTITLSGIFLIDTVANDGNVTYSGTAASTYNNTVNYLDARGYVFYYGAFVFDSLEQDTEYSQALDISGCSDTDGYGWFQCSEAGVEEVNVFIEYSKDRTTWIAGTTDSDLDEIGTTAVRDTIGTVQGNTQYMFKTFPYMRLKCQANRTIDATTLSWILKLKKDEGLERTRVAEMWNSN
jgi:hypothetical protein